MENNNFITEDYVNFETAKLLKEKGFNPDECEVHYDPYNHQEYEITLQMAMKFIRKRYNYHIIATPEYGDVEYMPGQWQEEFLGWKYSIIPLEGSTSLIHPSVYAKTPDGACEEGVKFMLNRKI